MFLSGSCLYLRVASLLLPVDGAGSRFSAVAAHPRGVPEPSHLHHVSNQQHQSLVGNQRGYLGCRLGEDWLPEYFALGLSFALTLSALSLGYFYVCVCSVYLMLFLPSLVCLRFLQCVSVYFALPDSLPTSWRLKVLFSCTLCCIWNKINIVCPSELKIHNQ